MQPYLRNGLLAAASLVLSTTAVSAATIQLDSNSGAVYDGIIDGFPSVYTKDGVGDALGNAPAVALQPGVTELRTVAHLSLAALAGLTSADIVSATLHFNIDDVLSSFGPGTAFDGFASNAIYVWAWNANGTIALGDFTHVNDGAPAGGASPGDGISDTTLGGSGPLPFTIDITNAVKARITASASHLGLLFATQDNNSGTSIDNKGIGGMGTPGVGGSYLPYVTVVTTDPPAVPPTFDAAQRKCQAAIGKAANSYTAALQKGLITCFGGVLKAVSESEDLAETTAKCAAQLDLDGMAPSKASKARSKAMGKITAACDLPVTPASLNAPCTSGATTFVDVGNCVLAEAKASAQATTAAAYADACSLITAVGLDLDFPAICNP